VGDDVGDDVDVGDAVGDPVGDVGDDVGDPVGDDVGDPVGDPVGDDVGDDVGDPVGDDVGDPAIGSQNRAKDSTELIVDAVSLVQVNPGFIQKHIGLLLGAGIVAHPLGSQPGSSMIRRRHSSMVSGLAIYV